MPTESALRRRLVAQRLLREASLELARLRSVRGAYRETARRITRARTRLAFAAALLAGAPVPEPAAAAGDPLFRHDFMFPLLIEGSIINSPTLADLDGDGDSDAWVGNGSGSTLFFANTGQAGGTDFAAPQTNPFGLADVGSYAAPAFADLDGDGDLDAFVGNATGNTVFFHNTGTATAPAFAAPSTDPFGLADVGGGATPTFADADDDGDLDALVGNGAGNLVFFQNTGTATAPAFAAGSTNPFGLANVGSIASPELADIDGDGDLDLFVGAWNTIGGSHLSFFENTGSAGAPAFAPPSGEPFGIEIQGVYRVAPAFSDVDGDGDLDALVAGQYNESSVLIAFENTGSAIAPALTDAGNPFGFGLLPLSLSYAIPSSETFADVDGDGDLDAFLSSGDGGLAFRRNTGNASTPSFAVQPPLVVGNQPDLADVDADGDLDAFVGVGSGDTTFFENTGTGSAPAFAAAVTNPFGLTAAGPDAAPTFADIDGDSDLDAFVGNADGNTILFQNTGTGAAPAFGPALTNPFGLSDVGSDAAPAFADIDADGDLDALVGAFSGIVLFFANTGAANAPAFAPPAPNPFGMTDIGRSASPAFSDVDGDGDLDAFVGRSLGDTIVLQNTGTAIAPAFVAPATTSFSLPRVGTYSSPAFGDLDGDGDPDVLIGGFAGNVFHLENWGTPAAPSFFWNGWNFGLNYAVEPYFVDIDGDGDLDLFSSSGGSTLFRENVGSATAPRFAPALGNPFGLASVGGSSSQHSTRALVDIDGDGDLDALIGDPNGSIVFFANIGTPSAPSFGAPSTNPFGLADVGYIASPDFADVDGDGDLDAFVGNNVGETILFRNTGTATAPAFAAPQANPFGLSGVGFVSSPDLADIDADGDIDATSAESFFGRVFFFENVSIDGDACQDALDNDGDGSVDASSDPGCSSPSDTSELGTRQCDNGLDDDGDGESDFEPSGGDPQCAGPLDDREAPDPPPGCGLGPELLLLVPLLAAERRRRNARPTPATA